MSAMRAGLVMAAVLFSTILCFVSCEENPADTEEPDTTASLFLGTWLRSERQTGGVNAFFPMTVVFDQDSVGSLTMMREEGVENQDFSWWSTSDSLFVQGEDEDQPMRFRYTLSGSNNLTLSYTDDGTGYIDRYVRWGSAKDPQVAGDWDQVSVTRDGVAVESGPIRVTIHTDGTGTLAMSGQQATFTWCTVESRFLSLNNSHIGSVGDWNRNGDVFTVGQQREDGYYLQTFQPYQINPGLDEELVGSWVMESFTIGGEYQRVEGIVAFFGDGTGNAHYASEFGVTFEEFGWTTENDTLTYMVIEPYDTTMYLWYDIEGSRAEFHNSNDGEAVVEVFWKDGGVVDEEMVGTWILTHPYSGDGFVQMAATSVLNSDGTCQMSQRMFNQDPFNPGWMEHIEMENYTWTAVGNRILVRQTDSPTGFVIPFTMDGNVGTFSIPWAGERDFHLFTGSFPENQLGTWVNVEVRIAGYPQAMRGSEAKFYNDGTGSISTVTDWDDDNRMIVQRDSINWFVDQDYLLILSRETGFGEVIAVESTGDVASVERFEFFPDYGTVMTMSIIEVRDTGGLDDNAAGYWIQVSETRNGADNPDFDPSTVSLNLDGTGSHTNDNGEETFTWSSNAAYIFIRFAGLDFIPPAMAIGYSISGTSLNLTMYERDEGSPGAVAVVETYTRQ
ncbi:hypothetical protein KQI63_08565 [bacterium]|nr:hypothetical protein [bacterium]